MIQKAVVKKVFADGQAEIEVQRQSACGHDCSKCGGCGSPTERIRAMAQNPVQAAEGEIVTIESENRKLLGVAALVYAVPIVLFFLFYGIAAAAHFSSAISAVSGICGFVLGILIAIFYNRHFKRQGGMVFTIIRKG